MITEIYADNYSCLTNFRIKLSTFQLWSGYNGTGKTAVLELLRKVQGVLTGAAIEGIFPASTLTSWDTREVQTFSVSLQLGGDAYVYKLRVEHAPKRNLVRIKGESLTWDEKVFYRFDGEEAHLYRINRGTGAVEEGAHFPADWSRSMMATIPEREDNEPLVRFRQAIRDMVVMQPIPILMGGVADKESRFLSAPGVDGGGVNFHGEEFAAWFRYLIQEYTEITSGLYANLKDVLPGFQSINLKDAGEARRLCVKFHVANQAHEFDFGKLSDGQRQLIVLYTVLEACKAGVVKILVLDEPDSFLGLREIQPWTHLLQDVTEEVGCQAILVSHHPQIINWMADDSECWFTRNEAGHVEVKPFPVVDGLVPAETYARGWDE